MASAAGVSASTVSNVLHDHPYVTAEVRARVERAINEIGYRPSYAGRQLRGRTGIVLALAVPDIRSPYFADLAHMVMTEARRRDITLFIDETDGALEQERLIAHGYPSRGIDGVIFCPVAISLAELEEAKSDIPTVLLGEYVPGGSFDHVAIDSRRSAREVAEQLIGSGRRSFAFAGFCRPPDRAGPAYRRLEGLRDALAAHRLVLSDDLVFDTSPHTREEGRRVAETLVDRSAPFDALVCAADLLAVGALAAFRERAVAVPEQVAVVGWDDSPEAHFTAPPLTSVAHDMQAIATRAIEAIQRRREDPARPVEHVVVAHRLVTRGSSG